MTNWNRLSDDGETEVFDYAYNNPTTGMMEGANHYGTYVGNIKKTKNPMSIKKRSVKDWEKEAANYSMEVWCVSCQGNN